MRCVSGENEGNESRSGMRTARFPTQHIQLCLIPVINGFILNPNHLTKAHGAATGLASGKGRRACNGPGPLTQLSISDHTILNFG